jgi:hypothetical protein
MSHFDDNEDYYTGLRFSRKRSNAEHYRAKREETVECARCGEDELRWFKSSTGWILLEHDGEKHICPVSTDGFKDEDAQ